MRLTARPELRQIVHRRHLTGMLTLSRRLRTAGAAASGPGALVGAVLLLAACGGGQAAAGPSPPPSSQSGSATALPPPAAPEPSPATPVTAADIRAVGEKVFAGPHPSGCDWRDRATCPSPTGWRPA